MVFSSTRRATNILTSAPLLLSLSVLLINDWYLKALYGNWLTGKLSDFAGILLLALIAFAFFPGRKWWGSATIFVAFALWKSPLVSPLIDGLNTWSPMSIGRVVDYTDLIALLMVPVAWRLVEHVRIPARNYGVLRRSLATSIFAVCCMSMVATTYATYGNKFEVQGTAAESTTDPKAIADVIQKAAKEFRLSCTDCEDRNRMGRYTGKNGTLDYIILSDGRVRIWIYSRSSDRPRRYTNRLQSLLKDINPEITFYEDPNDDSSLYHPERYLIDHVEVPRLRDVVHRILGDTAQSFDLEAAPGGRTWSDANSENTYPTKFLEFAYEDNSTIILKIEGNTPEFKVSLREAALDALNAAIPGIETFIWNDNGTHSLVLIDLKNASLPSNTPLGSADMLPRPSAAG